MSHLIKSRFAVVICPKCDYSYPPMHTFSLFLFDRKFVDCRETIIKSSRPVIGKETILQMLERILLSPHDARFLFSCAFLTVRQREREMRGRENYKGTKEQCRWTRRVAHFSMCAISLERRERPRVFTHEGMRCARARASMCVRTRERQ